MKTAAVLLIIMQLRNAATLGCPFHNVVSFLLWCHSCAHLSIAVDLVGEAVIQPLALNTWGVYEATVLVHLHAAVCGPRHHL